jgi:hypothetical protein
MIETAVNGVLIGIIATIAMDIWAAVAKHGLRLPTANWAMVGRWFGHMPRGVFVHRPIATAAPISNELAIGWVGHYLTGVIYGLTYLLIVQVALGRTPSLLSGLVFGLVTLVAPWLIMQPAMGAGGFASRTPRPAVTRLVNLSMHTVFGISLYGAWLLIR